MAKKRQRTPQSNKLAYFVRRKSHVDDTAFFNDEGKRVYFQKASWAAWVLRAIKVDQEPRVVKAAIQPDDTPYQEYLRAVLPARVTIREYLHMIETWTRETMRDSPLALRRVTAFLQRQAAKHGQGALYSATEEQT